MPTYLLTVESTTRDGMGLRLTPGVRPSEAKERPAISHMKQGSKLELRRPDGRVSQTRLVAYGVSVWKDEDGALSMNDDPRDPEIKLTLPADTDAEDVPLGTQVWLMEEDSA